MSRDIQHRADRLYETLQSQLDRFVVSQRFFSIRELIRRHRVARRIVEKVLARLQKEEQIRIEPARGIFVCERRRNTRIITSVHVHIDEDNCLEVIILKGETGEVQDVANLILGTKGVKTGRLVMTTTGEFI